MKKVLWLAPLIFLYCGMNAQTPTQGFVILNPTAVSNVNDFVYALNHNDLDRFRHADHRTTVHFTEGLNVELLSGKEMTDAGLVVDLSAVNTTAVDRMRHLQFSLDKSKRIIISATRTKKGS